MSKTALVTGASRGIGYEISVALAQQNHQVLAVARSADLLKQLEQKYPDRISIMPTDLTCSAERSDLAGTIAKRTSGIDILINNAGALINKPFIKLTMKDWQHMLDVNLLAAVGLIRQLIPYLSKKSHIVNISSMGGYQESGKFPGLSAYSVAKGALSILSECLAVELSEQDIRVNALCLGAVQTEMLQQAFPGFEAPVSAKEMGTYIAHFALHGSRFYNGQILPVTLSNPD